MVRVLTPVWVDGIQRLKIAPEAPAPLARGLEPPLLRQNSAIRYDRCLAQLRSKTSPIEQYIFLQQLKGHDVHMFYRIILDNMSEVTPLIYTPTVGDACLQFSHNYRVPEGIFVSWSDRGNIGKVLRNWPKMSDARIAVVTDGSRILGLGGELGRRDGRVSRSGVNGYPISSGKLSLYVAGAGVRPESTVPICLDLGTNNEKFLNDPLYLGMRRKRISDVEMDGFMDEFMREMKAVFPKLLVQFEDFSTDHAFAYLDRYRHKYPVFNDDIQGTGAVVLSGFMNAAKLSSNASGRPLSDHRILFLGSGSAGVGVGMQLMSFFTLVAGLSQEEARNRIYYIDSQGLITADRPNLAEHKKFFARTDCPHLTDLVDIIDYVKPTALLGLSTTKGAFDRDVVEAMAALNERPIIFPLSNPVRLCELDFPDAIEWTDGKVIFASGSPYAPVTYNGRTYYAGQGNNMYIFPGLGLGAILAGASSVTDSMVETSSTSLAAALTPEEHAAGLIYPRIERIREISARLATDVIIESRKRNVAHNPAVLALRDDEIVPWVKERMFTPVV
ncbi:malic enzyme [Auriculariales sp. MPI-PUGE-AT-0066]|nr:malic enzyme [Auriculariales sp. MPI-PUGE-AT-0066]